MARTAKKTAPQVPVAPPEPPSPIDRNIRRRIVEEILDLEKAQGMLQAADVVEAARNPNSALHSQFTWDETQAAYKQNLHEARMVIRSVKVEIIVRSVPLIFPKYIHDPAASAASVPGYRNIAYISRDEDLARSAIVDEMARMGAAVQRARKFALLFGAQEALDQIERLVEEVTATVSAAEEAGAQ